MLQVTSLNVKAKEKAAQQYQTNVILQIFMVAFRVAHLRSDGGELKDILSKMCFSVP